MAKKKNGTVEASAVLAFTKRQLVSAKRYARYYDFLNGNLKDDQQYTIAEVEALIISHYGKAGK